jgi:hypothetical protein
MPAETPAAGADSLNDAYYPQLGNGGYDALHYTIDLTVDVVNNKLDGVCTLDAQATQALASFDLDLHGLNVSAVTVNDAPAAFTRVKDKLVITPANPLTNGEKFTIAVSYAGRPQPVEDASSPGYPVGWFDDKGVGVVDASPSLGRMQSVSRLSARLLHPKVSGVLLSAVHAKAVCYDLVVLPWYAEHYFSSWVVSFLRS